MLTPTSIVAGGVPVGVLANAPSPNPLVFLNGGVPGVSPFCSGTHVWRGCLERFAAERAVLALDLPGSGGSGPPTDGLEVASLVRQVRLSLEALGIRRCHLIGHDLGGLVALSLAAECPMLVTGVSAVASVAAAPTGDGLENLALAHPPLPLWTRQSQRWALERLSYAHHPVDAALLDACCEAAAGSAHAAASAWMLGGAHAERFVPSLLAAKARLFETCRQHGIPVPVQVVWGTHDPLGTLEQGMWLYRIVAARQPVTQFHAINRAGSLPFREEPEAFHQIVSAFCDVTFPA